MSIDWNVVTDKVLAGLTAVAPIVEDLVPETAPAVAVIQQVLKGLTEAKPVAVALINQIKSGQPVSPDQLKEYFEQYKADDDALAADIAARLAQ